VVTLSPNPGRYRNLGHQPRPAVIIPMNELGRRLLEGDYHYDTVNCTKVQTEANLREDSMRLRELPGNLRKQAASLLKSGRAYYDSEKKNIRRSRKGDCCVPINDSPAAINKYLEESTRFVHLQGIGKTPAILARELRPGYVISWNYQPDSYVVKSIEVASPQYLRVSTEHIASGREYTQKLSRDRLVAARKPDTQT
jgi:hypothetical protein